MSLTVQTFIFTPCSLQSRTFSSVSSSIGEVVAGQRPPAGVVAGEAADAVLEHERADFDGVAADLEDLAQRNVVEHVDMTFFSRP